MVGKSLVQWDVLRPGPWVRTDGLGQYNILGMRDSIRAQGGHARGVLFRRVCNYTSGGGGGGGDTVVGEGWF